MQKWWSKYITTAVQRQCVHIVNHGKWYKSWYGYVDMDMDMDHPAVYRVQWNVHTVKCVMCSEQNCWLHIRHCTAVRWCFLSGIAGGRLQPWRLKRHWHPFWHRHRDNTQTHRHKHKHKHIDTVTIHKHIDKNTNTSTKTQTHRHKHNDIVTIHKHQMCVVECHTHVSWGF